MMSKCATRSFRAAQNHWNPENAVAAFLTHLFLQNWAGNCSRHFQMHFFFKENIWMSIKISLKFVPEGRIENKSASVEVMAWCRKGDKPLPKPMVTQFPDAYMRHQGDMSWPGLSLIPVWISNYIYYNVWDEITFPFPPFALYHTPANSEYFLCRTRAFLISFFYTQTLSYL